MIMHPSYGNRSGTLTTVLTAATLLAVIASKGRGGAGGAGRAGGAPLPLPGQGPRTPRLAEQVVGPQQLRWLARPRPGPETALYVFCLRHPDARPRTGRGGAGR